MTQEILMFENGELVIHRGVGRRTIPIVNDAGVFFASAGLAADRLNVSRTSISAAVRTGKKTASHIWRRASVAECQANGFDFLNGVPPTTEVEPSSMVEIPFKKPVRKANRKVVSTKVMKAKASETAPAKLVTKTPVEQRDALFYATRWPDGAVTIRAGRGSTWTITRLSEQDIPKEMLDGAVWLAAGR